MIKLILCSTFILIFLARCSSQQLSQYSYNHFEELVGAELKEIAVYSYSNQWFAELIACKPQARAGSKFNECVDNAFDRGRNRINAMYSIADRTFVEDKFVSERHEGIKKASEDFRGWSKFESHAPLNDDEMVAAIASLYYYEQLARKSYQENKATLLYATYTEAMTRYQDALQDRRTEATSGVSRHISSESRVRRLESLKDVVGKKPEEAKKHSGANTTLKP